VSVIEVDDTVDDEVITRDGSTCLGDERQLLVDFFRGMICGSNDAIDNLLVDLTTDTSIGEKAIRENQ
jgi:hypothetical protein